MTNIVTINNQESVVSLNDIVKYSGNKTESVKRLIKTHQDRLIGFSQISNPTENFLKRYTKGNNTGDIDWDNTLLNEPQTMFLMTLLKNSEEVVEFKDKLIHQFTNMHKTLIEVREQALVDYHKEEIARVKAEKRKLNTYENGFKSVTAIKQELGIEESTSFIFEALEYAGITYNEIIPTTFRRLCDDVPTYVGAKSPNNNSPILLPAAVEKALEQYREHLTQE